MGALLHKSSTTTVYSTLKRTVKDRFAERKWQTTLVCCGRTTGEFTSMTMEERMRVTELTRANWPGIMLNNVSAASYHDAQTLLAHSQNPIAGTEVPPFIHIVAQLLLPGATLNRRAPILKPPMQNLLTSPHPQGHGLVQKPVITDDSWEGFVKLERSAGPKGFQMPAKTKLKQSTGSAHNSEPPLTDIFFVCTSTF